MFKHAGVIVTAPPAIGGQGAPRHAHRAAMYYRLALETLHGLEERSPGHGSADEHRRRLHEAAGYVAEARRCVQQALDAAVRAEEMTALHHQESRLLRLALVVQTRLDAYRRANRPGPRGGRRLGGRQPAA